jgi:hypothetical protein
MRDMIAAQQKGVLQIQYQDLLNHFQMSADERDQFMKLILDKQMARMDLGMQAMSADGNQTADEKAALKQQMSEQDATADAQIQDFFNNDADFAYFQTYEKQLPEHQDLSSLNTSLTQAGQPLNDEQSDAMLNLMVQASKDSKAATPTPTDPTQPPSGSAMDAALQQQEQEQNEIAEGAASVLTPQQLDILKREQAAKMQMLKVGLQMSRQMFGGGSGPSGSAGNSAPAPPP